MFVPCSHQFEIVQSSTSHFHACERVQTANYQDRLTAFYFWLPATSPPLIVEPRPGLITTASGQLQETRNSSLFEEIYNFYL
ncbi:unnamed protein product [Hermetia illucens]|uniref:Uncharacterized protein n=1 Tax=Hermetia illucens TaxID=343691 RepID=A0A7R8V6Y0_HERIL|nr:unnamed protein product [Hermetia illucens]